MKITFFRGLAILIAFSGANAILITKPWLKPTSKPDPQLEYVMRPGTTYVGTHRTTINDFHMRTDDKPPYKVLILGDSVALGSCRIDQSKTFSALLGKEIHGPIGNASANSWGPQNLFAYVERYGLLEAEAVLIVWNFEDASDVIGQSNPDHKPRPAAIQAAGDLLDFVLAEGAKPLVVLWPSKQESVSGNEHEGTEVLRKLCESKGVPTLRPVIPEASYLDRLHPSRRGHLELKEQVAPLVKRLLDH